MNNENKDIINENDTYVEDRIRSSEVEIPESLRPDNIEQKLAAITHEEFERRSRSEDVPFEKSENTVVSIEKKRNKNAIKIVLPIAIAASLILMFGLGMKIGSNRRVKEDSATAYTDDVTVDSVSISDEEEDVIVTGGFVDESDEPVVSEGADETEGADEIEETDDTDKNEKTGLFGKSKTDNYDQAYDVLNEYKEYLEDLEKKRAKAAEDYEDDGIRYNKSNTLSGVASTYSASAVAQSGTASEDAYYTDTNVRTEGVSEADVVKTDGKYIYEYDSSTEHINIYSAADGKIEKISSINLLKNTVINIEMYVEGDRLILVGKEDQDSWVEDEDGNSVYTNRLFDRYTGSTAIVLYNIKDRTNPEFIKKIVQDGTYDSSRLVGDYLYTFSRKNMDVTGIKKKDRKTYIPVIDGDFIPNSDLVIQPEGFNQTYMVISAVNIKKGKITDKMGLLAGGNSMYVSDANIFFTDRRFNWRRFGFLDDSKIIKVAYGKGELEYKCEGTFPGYLNDDYSIDEYDGNLRLVTTYRDGGMTYNGLYVYDKNLKKLSVLKRLAEGETIKSARFMGKTAYFVTFRNTDPLFAVDLSDPENPEITDYLKIPGFSAYLHPYSDGLLLGIGYDTNEYGGTNCIKLSMFDITDPKNIKEKDKMILDIYEYANVFGNRRALMFDDRDGLFGFVGTLNYEYRMAMEDDGEDYDINNYLVFDYDEKDGFKTKLEYSLGKGSLSSGAYDRMDETRGVVIGDYLYLVESGEGITSFDTKNFKKVEEYK